LLLSFAFFQPDIVADSAALKAAVVPFSQYLIRIPLQRCKLLMQWDRCASVRLAQSLQTRLWIADLSHRFDAFIIGLMVLVWIRVRYV
jgi:hypothetical protein